MKEQSQPKIEASLGLGMPKNCFKFFFTVLMDMNILLGSDQYNSLTVHYCFASSIHQALKAQEPIKLETSCFHQKSCLITSLQHFQSNLIVKVPHFELFSIFQDGTIAKFATLGGSHNRPWEMQIIWVRLAKLTTVIVKTFSWLRSL